MSSIEDKAFLEKAKTSYNKFYINMFTALVDRGIGLGNLIELSKTHDIQSISCLSPNLYDTILPILAEEARNYDRVCQLVLLSIDKHLDLKQMSRLLKPCMLSSSPTGHWPGYLDMLEENIKDNSQVFVSEPFLTSTIWKITFNNHSESKIINNAQVFRFFLAISKGYSLDRARQLAWYEEDAWEYIETLLDQSQSEQPSIETFNLLWALIDKRGVLAWKSTMEKHGLTLVKQLQLLDIVNSNYERADYPNYLDYLATAKKYLPKVRFTRCDPSYLWLYEIYFEAMKHGPCPSNPCVKDYTDSWAVKCLKVYDSLNKENHSDFYDISDLDFNWLELVLENNENSNYLKLGMSNAELSSVYKNLCKKSTSGSSILKKFWYYKLVKKLMSTMP